MTAASVQPVCISDIKNGGAQSRIEMRQEIIQEYAQDMRAGASFPPIVVFCDGEQYWLGDGYHRLEAARKIERQTIDAEIREGTARDAILHGVGANASHGLRRTQADKRRAVERLLTDPDWARWSDRKIATIARVDHKTVGKVRRELTGEISTPPAKPNGQGGEIPTPDKASGGVNSIFDEVLQRISDDALMAECRRRGLIDV